MAGHSLCFLLITQIARRAWTFLGTPKYAWASVGTYGLVSARVGTPEQGIEAIVQFPHDDVARSCISTIEASENHSSSSFTPRSCPLSNVTQNETTLNGKLRSNEIHVDLSRRGGSGAERELLPRPSPSVCSYAETAVHSQHGNQAMMT